MEYAILLPFAVLALGALGTLWTLKHWVSKSDGRFHLRWTKALLVGPILLGLVYPSLVVTPPGHRGVVFSQSGGVQTTERVEGLSFVIPYFQSAAQMNVQIQRLSIEVLAQTKDVQEVTVPIDVNYSVDPTWAAELYRDIGKDYERAVIEPAVLQIAKAAIGQINAEDFARNRAVLALIIRDILAEALDQEGIVIVYVAVSDSIFDPLWVNSVRDKVIADQEAQEQERLVAARKAEADQAIATAEGVREAAILVGDGIAEANRLIDASLTENVLRWQALVSWTGHLPDTYIGGAELADLPALLIQP